jgi:hypothetical protein
MTFRTRIGAWVERHIVCLVDEDEFPVYRYNHSSAAPMYGSVTSTPSSVASDLSARPQVASRASSEPTSSTNSDVPGCHPDAA